MKQHYTELTLRPGMDATRMANARPICGQKPTYYLAATTNNWAEVDCRRCLSRRPGLQAGQGVMDSRGRIGLVTDGGPDTVGVIWQGGAYAVKQQTKDLSPVTLIYVSN